MTSYLLKQEVGQVVLRLKRLSVVGFSVPPLHSLSFYVFVSGLTHTESVAPDMCAHDL